MKQKQKLFVGILALAGALGFAGIRIHSAFGAAPAKRPERYVPFATKRHGHTWADRTAGGRRGGRQVDGARGRRRDLHRRLRPEYKLCARESRARKSLFSRGK